jgi:hypothetical protein
VSNATAALTRLGIPLWAWIAIARLILLALSAAVTRRRRPTQAIIKTRLG